MWGSDFSHVFANRTYHVMDLIMTKFNEDVVHNNVNIAIEYSTMAKFFKSVYEDAQQVKLEWPVWSEDLWEYRQKTD